MRQWIVGSLAALGLALVLAAPTPASAHSKKRSSTLISFGLSGDSNGYRSYGLNFGYAQDRYNGGHHHHGHHHNGGCGHKKYYKNNGHRKYYKHKGYH